MINKKTIWGLIVSTLMVIALVFLRILFIGGIRYLFILWNLFLCWVPFILSTMILKGYQRKQNISIYEGVLGVIWLVFYPNAPYIITDFIHLSDRQFWDQYGIALLDGILWYDLILFLFFIILGFVLGVLSLLQLHCIISTLKGDRLGWLFAISTLVLSSFAIYLGRFLRLNSWQLFTEPMKVIIDIFNSLSFDVLLFCGIISLFLIWSYWLFYLLQKDEDIWTK